MSFRPRAVLLLLGAILLGVAGVLFGLTEALALSAGILGLLAAVTIRSLLLRPEIVVARTAAPPRCYVGDPAVVWTTLQNSSRRRSPALTVTQQLDRRGTIGVQFPPLRPFEVARASYSIPTDRRGLVRLGPVVVDVVDPFGLTCRRIPVEAPDMVIAVRPRSWLLDDISAFNNSRGDVHNRREQTPLGSGDEFSSLHEYTAGDDVRRIHWPSTARLGRPIVRRNEPPADRRITIVLDARAAGDPTGFERALSVVASVIRSSTPEVPRLIVLGAGGGRPQVDDQERSLGRSGHDLAELLLDKLCVVEQGTPHHEAMELGHESHESPTLHHNLTALAGNAMILVTSRSLGAFNNASDKLVLSVARHASGLLVSTSSLNPSPGTPTWTALLGIVHWNGNESLPAALRDAGLDGSRSFTSGARGRG